MTIIEGDALAVLRAMPAERVHCCCSSPPYWGLRDYGVRGQAGLERTPAEYLERMVEVFAEVRRVLRRDGTLWLNMGDCYYSSPSGYAGTSGSPFGHSANPRGASGYGRRRRPKHETLKAKDLVGMPWRLALALQEDGWWLRRDVIWSKPNPMPESVRDRPTTAHEYVFLLSKSRRYFYDAEAVREPDGGGDHPRHVLTQPEPSGGILPSHGGLRSGPGRQGQGRSLRSVWTIPTAAFPEAHFATFPPELARRCIAAGSSARGCCSECGAPWVSRITVAYENPGNRTSNGRRSAERRGVDFGSAGFERRLERRASIAGWVPGCGCAAPVEGCTVLDPFAGAGTTAMVALRMGRRAIGIELKPEYCAMAARRIERDAPLLNRVDAASFSAPLCIHGGRAGPANGRNA